MPRPNRCRRVCAEPAFRNFSAENGIAGVPVTLFVDEFESVRLVDFEKLNHTDAAERMQISRTTLTEIYERARYKIAQALVKGQPLVIRGGHYRLCAGTDEQHCCGGHCRRDRMQDKTNTLGERQMKIAVPLKNDTIYQHFGMAQVFKTYTVQDGKIESTDSLDASECGHGQRVALLAQNAVSCVICGGIGDGSIESLRKAGIELIPGVCGSADEAVLQLLTGTLVGDIEAARAKQRHAQRQKKENGGCCGHEHGGEGCCCHGAEEGHACCCKENEEHQCCCSGENKEAGHCCHEKEDGHGCCCGKGGHRGHGGHGCCCGR